MSEERKRKLSSTKEESGEDVTYFFEEEEEDATYFLEEDDDEEQGQHSTEHDDIHSSKKSLTHDIIVQQRIERRKLKKQFKKEQKLQQKQQQLPGYEFSSIYPSTLKKLLILDLNKVLLYRKKGTIKFIPRPYVIEFLKDMAQRFQLAIWTSMKPRSSHDLLQILFHQHHIPLLFTWFQSRCTIEKRTRTPGEDSKDENVRKISVKDTIFESEGHLSFTSSEGQIQINNPHSTNQLQLSSSINSDISHKYQRSESIEIQDDGTILSKTILPIDGIHWSKSTVVPSSSSLVNDLPEDDPKPIFYKELKRVWSAYRLFNTKNTILLDDTEEKCLFNPKYNCIHPKAFELDITDQQFHAIVNKEPLCYKPTLLTTDEELKPNGSLWTYLDRIARDNTSIEELFTQYGPYVH